MPEAVVRRAIPLVAGERVGGTEENGIARVAVDVMERRSEPRGTGSVVAWIAAIDRDRRIFEKKRAFCLFPCYVTVNE